MAVETDRLIIGAFALWAGDFEKFRSLIRGTAYEVATLQDEAESPEAIIAATSALRLRQLGQKRSEFKFLAAAQRNHETELTDQPLILHTENIRATVWRTAQREFSLQGYLSNLAYEKHLFAHVHELREPIARTADAAKTRFSELENYDAKPALPLGGAWSMPGNPFVQAEVSDMGLIEATATWTLREMPEEASAVTSRFQELLDSLDPPRRHTTPKLKDE